MPSHEADGSSIVAPASRSGIPVSVDVIIPQDLERASQRIILQRFPPLFVPFPHAIDIKEALKGQGNGPCRRQIRTEVAVELEGTGMERPAQEELNFGDLMVNRVERIL